MKVNIASPGRFHVLDLARELYKLGHDVRFYSYVPDSRAEKFGLPRKCNRSLYLLMLPFLALSRLSGRFRPLAIQVQDFCTGLFMRKCDVFIAMSGNYVYSLKKAKKRGAKVILERGSKHILDQKQILESLPSNVGKKPVPDINVKRELLGYKIADYISIPSHHVEVSCIDRGIRLEKLFVNPYGVDVADFHALEGIEKKYDLIFAGTWSYQKGADLLTAVCEKRGYKLLHVGTLGDAPFPTKDNFTHIDKVDQKELIKYYNQAKVFALPSRQDGFGLVLLQAISCKLPIVCSFHTGGYDLARIANASNWVFIMKEYNESALEDSISKALSFDKYESYESLQLQNLSWEAYGRRYSDFLNQIVNG